MTTNIEKPVASVEAALALIPKCQQAEVADGILQGVTTGFKIATVEDREQASDTLNLLKRSAKVVGDAITDALRPVKSFETQVRAATVHRWLAGANTVEAEMRRWDREAEAKRRAAEAEARRLSDLAAQAAAQQAATLDEDDALPPAQIIAPPAANIVRGGLATDHKSYAPVAVELVDAATAAREWGKEVLALVPSEAKARYAAKMKLGLLTLPPEEGIVVGGILWRTHTSYVSKRATP